MATPEQTLAVALQRAQDHLTQPLIPDDEVVTRIETISRNIRNRACTRFVLACSLAKAHRPEIDIRKPYTEIKDQDHYSGRAYDERYITAFVMAYQLPCNNTTAFLTPAFRNRNQVLTPDTIMVGEPEALYRETLQLLSDRQSGRVSAEDVLAETIRWLFIIRDEQRVRIDSLLAGLKALDGTPALSAERIISLVEQHLKLRHSSRLPVLIVAAAYQSASHYLGENVLPLQRHNAADEQTGSLGDLEIVLIDDSRVLTSYEMKTRRVTQNDIDHALQKIQHMGKRIDNYIFST